jgi:predicted dehydrogenase
MSTELRLGLIGCGRLAERGYVPAIADLERVSLTAVADPNPARRDRIARLAAADGPVPTDHASAGELITGGEIDGLVIASPPSEHVWQAELASRAAIPTLVEKPPAPGFAGARRLAELTPPPWIGFNRRFQHVEPLLAELPPSEELVFFLEIRYRRASWQPVSADDGVLSDLAPHLIDLALVLGGAEEARVVAASVSHAHAEIELRVARGTALINCSNDRAYREVVEVRRAGGQVLARTAAGGALSLIADRIPGRAHPLVASLRAQLDAFGSAIAQADPGLLATAAEGALAMALIDDAHLLAEERRAA